VRGNRIPAGPRRPARPAGPAGRRARVERIDTAPLVTPVVGPTDQPIQAADAAEVGAPRLARHLITLSDGHQVGVAICGRGVPLVLVHGFSAEGILYAQTLSRLVSMGFKVVAIDQAGHGGTLGLPTGGATMADYAELLGRVVDELGIRRAVFMGHSMGGRLVTELVAAEPDRAIGVILLDAIVGDTWDRMVNLFRFTPPLLAGIGGLLAVDTLTTVPVFRDPRQAVKLGRLIAPTIAGHVRRPWRLIAPAVSILRSGGTADMLDQLGAARVPLFVIHGDCDLAVPIATAKAASRRGDGDLVVIHRASHSWLLKDPEALPGVMLELMKGRLGTARLRAVMVGGVDPVDATQEEVESVFFEPDALVSLLTPTEPWDDREDMHQQPRYRWTIKPQLRRAG
jgi:pimeloyl-ACP methyl ester carboxylesterase